MSVSNKVINVLLIGVLGLLGLGLSLYLIVGTDRAVSAVYETGLDRLQAGDLESARAAFERAYERSRDKAPAAYQLARLEAREDPDAAVEWIDKALAGGEPSGEMLVGMANIAMAAGEVGMGRDLIARLQLEDPSNRNILPLRGRLAMAQRRYGEAIALFEELLASGSATDDVKLVLGQVLSRSPDPVDRTRAKVILLDAAAGNTTASRNALLFLASAGVEGMEARDWRHFFRLASEKGFLEWDEVEENLPLLRRLMVLATRYAQDLTGEIAERRVAHPDAAAVDLVDGALMAQREQNLRRAQQLLDSVPAEEQDSLGVRMLRAHQLILEGRPDAGMVALEKVVNEAPDAPSAVPLLRNLANGPEGMLSVREQITVLTLLKDHTHASLRDRFDAYRGLLNLRPLATDEILREVAEEIGPHAPEAVSQWFLEQGHPAYAEELITVEQARGDPHLFELRLAALLRQGKLDAAAEQLAGRPPAIPSLLLTIGQLRLAVAHGELEEARSLWEEALRTADRQGRRPYFAKLANLALEFDAPDLARQAFQLAFERGATMSERDWLQFTTLAGESGNLAHQRAVAMAAEHAYPDNPVFINNAAYLELLSGENVRANLAEMERLVDENPNVDAFRVTLALAYLRSDRAGMAVRTMERIEMDWSPAGASAQVIYLASLAEGNRRGMAENFARNVDVSALLPEEVELIASLLGR